MKNEETRASMNPEDELDFFVSSSMQDCTGLIPFLPKSDSEINSYADLYSFLPRAVRSKIGEDETF